MKHHLRVLALLMLLLPAAAWAQDLKFTALLIYNFTKYIEWPAEGGEFALAVLGDDPVVDELKTIAGKETARKLTVRKVMSLDQVAAGTSLLYISPDKSSQLPAAMAKFATANTLIVTNKEGLGKEGASINLMYTDGKLRFEINPESLKKTGLKAKPALFKLGTTV